HRGYDTPREPRNVGHHNRVYINTEFTSDRYPIVKEVHEFLLLAQSGQNIANGSIKPDMSTSHRIRKHIPFRRMAITTPELHYRPHRLDVPSELRSFRQMSAIFNQTYGEINIA